MGLQAEVKTCDIPDGCEVRSIYHPTWTVSAGNKYLEIVLSNETSNETNSKFLVTGIRYSPNIEMVCNLDFTGMEFVPNLRQPIDCRTAIEAASLPDEVCYEIEYPELFAHKVPAESPKATVCRPVMGR